VVALGNLLVDDLVFNDGSTRMGEAGGAVLHFALAGRLWPWQVGVVSIKGTDYPEWAFAALRERGVDVAGVRELEGPGLRSWLLYEDCRRQVVHRLDRPTHADVSPGPAAIPGAWCDAPCLHLAPMPLSVQEAVTAAFPPRPGRLVSLDPFVPLRPDTLSAWRELLQRVDVLFLSEDELQLGGPLDDPRTALCDLVGERPWLVLLKRGARGGLAWDVRGDRLVPWPARASTVVDATGAGDAFAAGVLQGLLQGQPLERALARGVTTASFALEDWGPRGLLRASPDQSERRLREWFG